MRRAPTIPSRDSPSLSPDDVWVHGAEKARMRAEDKATRSHLLNKMHAAAKRTRRACDALNAVMQLVHLQRSTRRSESKRVATEGQACR